MEKRIYPEPIESVVSPEPYERRSFTDAEDAVEALKAALRAQHPVPARLLRRARQGRRPQQALPRLLSRSRRHDLVLQPGRLAPGLWPHADAGHLLDHDHPARPVRKLPARAAAADHAQSRRAGHGGGIRARRSRCISPSWKAPMSTARSPSASSGRSATCSTCRISTGPTTTSPTARSRRCPARTGRWRPSPHSASTIRCTGCRITPPPARSISRTSCCSPTTSSTSTSSASMPAT